MRKSISISVLLCLFYYLPLRRIVPSSYYPIVVVQASISVAYIVCLPVSKGKREGRVCEQWASRVDRLIFIRAFSSSASFSLNHSPFARGLNVDLSRRSTNALDIGLPPEATRSSSSRNSSVLVAEENLQTTNWCIAVSATVLLITTLDFRQKTAGNFFFTAKPTTIPA